jgi:hypothetical protein
MAFWAKSRTVRARCFLNASSNMTKPKCCQAKNRCYLKSTARKMVKAWAVESNVEMKEAAN